MATNNALRPGFPGRWAWAARTGTGIASRIARALEGLLLAATMAVGGAEAWTVERRAGTGRPDGGSVEGKAAEVSLNNPFGVVRGPDGAWYFCEYDGQVIRRLDGEGRVTRVAGCGRRGGGGDGGPARDAEFNQPHEIRFDAEGNLHVADMQNHRIRRIDARTGIITTLAGTGEAGFSGDGGPAVAARLRQPHGIQFDATGRLYIGDIGNHRIRRVDPGTGIITTFAGTGERGPTPDGGRFASVPLNGPRAFDFDRSGGLWLALREGNRVYRLDVEKGTLHHVAGTGAKGFGGNGGTARECQLSGPKGLAVGPDGAVYLADTESHSVRRIDPARGIIERVAGDGTKGDGPDGPAEGCRLARPHGIWVDPDGTVWVGDSENHCLRVIRRRSRS